MPGRTDGTDGTDGSGGADATDATDDTDGTDGTDGSGGAEDAAEYADAADGSGRDRYDVHEHRHQLKLVKQTGDTSLWAGRGATCPACGAAFDRLFVTETRTHSFPGGAPFCVLNEPDRVLLFTHAEG